MEPKYKRILLKISGESLAGDKRHGFSSSALAATAKQIATLNKAGVEIGVVVGGGNFWRGREGDEMDRTSADYMGMLATVINALALSDALDRQGVDNRVMTALAIDKIGEPYNVKTAKRYLSDGKVVVFGGGTGSPFFTTDTGASRNAGGSTSSRKEYRRYLRQRSEDKPERKKIRYAHLRRIRRKRASRARYVGGRYV